MARLIITETAKPDRNLGETSFGFRRSFDDRECRKRLPIGSGGEVSPLVLAPARPMGRFGAKIGVYRGCQIFSRSTL